MVPVKFSTLSLQKKFKDGDTTQTKTEMNDFLCNIVAKLSYLFLLSYRFIN